MCCFLAFQCVPHFYDRRGGWTLVGSNAYADCSFPKGAGRCSYFLERPGFNAGSRADIKKDYLMGPQINSMKYTHGRVMAAAGKFPHGLFSYMYVTLMRRFTFRYMFVTKRSHTIPYHTIPYHPIPSHTIPSHTISLTASLCLMRWRWFTWQPGVV